MVAKRFDIWTVPLDPSLGSEFQKTRPCIIVSPDEANRHLNTVVVVPMTSSRHQYTARTNLTFGGQDGQAATDQVRVIDKQRLMSRIGQVDTLTGAQVLHGLREFFS
ncbi:type II toxin-antitoxin system PemK/MazF family toxin [Candidatus Saccharibacteria bacterium]|nr:type II toxin-antitoxin system PemK/MazF family toxin [Candidatus Saccharibacteria bacterium]